MLPYTLNLLDLVLTLYALSNGATELNPLLQNIPIMIVYKTVVVGVLCYWLTTRSEPIARLGLQLATAIFGLVVLYHIHHLTH